MRRLTRFLAVAGALLLAPLANAATAHAADVTPNHAIVCRYTPNTPYQLHRGGPVYANAHITCNDSPDVSSTTIRIWRYDTIRKKYYEVGESSSNQTGTDWWISTAGPCTATIAYPMHTE